MTRTLLLAGLLCFAAAPASALSVKRTALAPSLSAHLQMSAEQVEALSQLAPGLREEALEILSPLQRAQLDAMRGDARLKVRRDALHGLLLAGPGEEAPQVLDGLDATPFGGRRGRVGYGAYGGYGYGGAQYGVGATYGSGPISVHAGIGRGGPSFGVGVGYGYGRGGYYGGW